MTRVGVTRAETCPQAWEAAAGPLPGGTGPADFGAIPEPCLLQDGALRLRAALLVAPAMPDYYGSIFASATLRVRVALGGESWLSVAADGLDYRYINNGGLAATAWSAGPATVAYHLALAATARIAAAAYVRLLLPLDTARSNGIETGLETGASVRARLGSRFAVDGGFALTTPVDVIGTEAHARLEPVGLAEMWYSPTPAMAVAGGVAARVELLPDPTFITLVPRLTGRLALRRGAWVAVLAELPVVGSDRTDLVASLFAGYAP